MAQQFKPVKLVKGDRVREAKSADEETNLRFNGYKTAPKPSAPKAVEKSDSK